MVRTRYFAFILLIICNLQTNAQPYFDVFSVSGMVMPQTGEYQGTLNLSLPFEAGLNRRVALSPFFDNRLIADPGRDLSQSVFALAVPVTYMQYFSDSVWFISTTIIPRYSGVTTHYRSNGWQFGGAVMVAWRINRRLKFRLGLYYNREFFSDFFIPLAGLDWKVNDRLMVFGTLPNNLKVEYRLKKRWYTGLFFKSFTNSFRDVHGEGYYKLSDNHLGLFSDCYITPHFVWGIEAGHTLLRHTVGRNVEQRMETKYNALFVKTGFYYRIRM